MTLMLGDEAVAYGAVDAGAHAAYGYPGTPSTEILETIIGDGAIPVAQWCVNEKAALEQALGAVLAGKRAIVTMKHVGLNVAADPFLNAALLDLNAGLVVAVADDPGMASSQNEQDSRFYAAFAHTICLEPADQQEAYDMCIEAFELSERHSAPVLLRLVTRLAHSRAAVMRRERPEPADGADAPKPADAPPASDAPKPADVGGADGRLGGAAWSLIPANARRRWRSLLDRQQAMRADPFSQRFNRYDGGDDRLLVVTAGTAVAYFDEVAPHLGDNGQTSNGDAADRRGAPSRLHVGHYPVSPELLRRATAGVEEILVLEDGYPHLEGLIRGVVGFGTRIRGRTDGTIPTDGELTTEAVRTALGLPARATRTVAIRTPERPPQFCRGCPHADSHDLIRAVLDGRSRHVVTSDIGCYALGALPPYHIVDSVVCMGASIGMAKGAAEAGASGVIATIGDSTFLHSGIPSLIDAVEAHAAITVMILDNELVAMTGGQPTASTRLESIVAACGVASEHIVVLNPIPKAAAENTESLAREVDYGDVSVVIARRSCITLKKPTVGRRPLADAEPRGGNR